LSKGPFRYIEAINGHQDIPVGKDYDKFLVNRHFSLFVDTIFTANTANMFPADIDNEMHFRYYLAAVKKRNRWTKWPKAVKSEILKTISDYFECSFSKAQEMEPLFTDGQIKEMTQELIERGEF
jgi:hypothetical protein